MSANLAPSAVGATWYPSEAEADYLRTVLPPHVQLQLPNSDGREGLSRFVCSRAALDELVRDADALIGWTSLPAEMLVNADRLKFIAWLHVGCDLLDLPALASQGISVANVTGSNSSTVAEHAMGFILAFAKRLRENDECVRQGKWHGWWEPASDCSTELRGATICIVGFGNIGRALATMCYGFGMNVLAIRRSPNEAVDEVGNARVAGASALLDFVSAADYTVLSIPLTSETRGLVGTDVLRRMKHGSYLINVSRGELVREEALYRALTEGRLGGFATDVWWDYSNDFPEGYHWGLPSRLGVHHLPNVIGSGDAAANTLGVKDRMIELGAQSLAAFFSGDPIPRLVDPNLGY